MPQLAVVIMMKYNVGTSLSRFITQESSVDMQNFYRGNENMWYSTH